MLKWGLIGCGDIAQKRVAPALRSLPNCELTAVSRARPELAESFAKAFGARKWCAAWQEVLRDPEIDAVYIATPPRWHAEQTIAAADAGKHVLCEKPMAIDVAECKRMISACRANKVKLGIAYYRHCYPAVARIKQLLASGELGQVVLAQVNAFEWFDPPPDHPRHWFIKREAGGGPMFDFGCHRIELLLHLLGPIRHVSGLTTKAVFEREVEDTAAALFQFETGACATLAVTHAAAGPRDTLDIFGTSRSLHVPVLNKGEVRIQTGEVVRIESHPPASNLHQPLIEDFVQAIREDRPPVVTGEIGKAVAEIEASIYASAKADGRMRAGKASRRPR
jgi:predicted dehydrogenase